MFAPAVPMTTSQHPRMRGVAGEAVARRDPDERHKSAEPGEVVEGEAVEAGDADPVGVTRAPTPAFGEEDDRQAPALGDLEQPVLLLVAEEPLRAGEHGVVVRHRHDRATVDRAHAADDAVGRGALDELLERAATALRGHDQRPVLDERSLVDEIGDVLPRRAASRVVTPRDGVRAGG